MKYRVLGQALLAAGLILGAGSAEAAGKSATPPQAVFRSDADLTRQVRHELLTYPRFTIWDDISFRVSNGQVELQGFVSQPYKKDDMERLVRGIPGVVSLSTEYQGAALIGFR